MQHKQPPPLLSAQTANASASLELDSLVTADIALKTLGDFCVSTLLSFPSFFLILSFYQPHTRVFILEVLSSLALYGALLCLPRHSSLYIYVLTLLRHD